MTWNYELFAQWLIAFNIGALIVILVFFALFDFIHDLYWNWFHDD